MDNCLICSTSHKSLGAHIRSHKISSKDYYDKYIRMNSDKVICSNPDCNNECSFNSINRGYSNCCSQTCRLKVIWTNDEYRSQKSNQLSISQANRWENDDYRSSMTEVLTKANKIHSNKPETKLSNSIKFSNRINELNRSSFLSKSIESGSKLGFIYLSIHDNNFKVGICRSGGRTPDNSTYFDLPRFDDDGNDLYHLRRRLSNSGSRKFEFYLGTIYEVSDLEFELKNKFIPSSGIELFDNINLEEFRKLINTKLIIHKLSTI